MTTGEGAADSRTPLSRVVTHPLVIWIGFLLAHLWVGWLGLTGIGNPFGDLDTYAFWVGYGLDNGVWVGIDTLWVYPIVALVPMLIAAIPGFEAFQASWVSLVLIADMAAFALAFGFRPRPAGAAWWWSAFLVLLGPIAVGRIDAFSVAAAIAGVAVLSVRPTLAGVLLAAATWIKVWPAAVLAAIVLVVRQRIRVVLGAAGFTVAVFLVVLGFGGANTILSFLGTQNDRGLQIESVLATPLMWLSAAGDAGAGRVYFDSEILTFQLDGPLARIVAAGATPLLLVLVAALLALGLIAQLRGVRAGAILPPLVTALTVALIVGNKVGSPQFASWLAVPILCGLVSASRYGGSFRLPAVLALAIGALTQAIYPTFYSELVALNTVLLVLLTMRNVLYVVLLTWAVAKLIRLVVRPPADERFPVTNTA